MMRSIFSKTLTLTFMMLCCSFASIAQDDQPLTLDIGYGMTVEDSISDQAFFDWWYLEVEVGDRLVISMEANDGLQPLLGLLDTAGTLVARSDEEAVADVDGVSFLQHTAESAGQYTIIATRDGRDQGTTTGRYRLTVTNRADTASQRPNPFLETEFRCGEWLLTNALTFQFVEDTIRSENMLPAQQVEYYRISVYGLDGFEPIVRLLSDIQDRPLDCTDSATATEGSQLDLPFLDTVYQVTTDDTDHVTMVTLTNTREDEPLGDITISIGAKASTSGRFIVVLEGLELHERTDEDEFIVRRGAFAKDTHLDIYMIGYPDNRLDPVVELLDSATGDSRVCDDIGSDDCADLPPITPSTFIISEDGTTYSADRFDAGIRLDLPDNPLTTIVLHSRERTTSGEYLVVFVGELPPRE